MLFVDRLETVLSILLVVLKDKDHLKFCGYEKNKLFVAFSYREHLTRISYFFLNARKKN